MIEVCAPNFEIAKAAYEAGANRLEICQGLQMGGLTPSYGFIEKACALPIPIRVLIRPRPGNFLYTVDEMELMLRNIAICEELGAEGVVIGALNESNEIDLGTNRIFRDSSEALKFIFHRGADLTGIEGIAAIQKLNFHGVLCSGHLDGLSAGIEKMKQYKALELSEFELVAGGGLNQENLKDLLELGFHSFHFSCQKTQKESEHAYGFSNVFDIEKWNRLAQLIA